MSTNVFIFNIIKTFCDDVMQNVLGKQNQTCQHFLYFIEINRKAVVAIS